MHQRTSGSQHGSGYRRALLLGVIAVLAVASRFIIGPLAAFPLVAVAVFAELSMLRAGDRFRAAIADHCPEIIEGDRLTAMWLSTDYIRLLRVAREKTMAEHPVLGPLANDYTLLAAVSLAILVGAVASLAVGW